MESQSPFKFLKPFEKGEHHLFFGREKESKELYEMTRQSNVTLVYGKSGSGKTSLIKCGLANEFGRDSGIIVEVRRNQNINDSLLKSIHSIEGEAEEVDDSMLASFIETDAEDDLEIADVQSDETDPEKFSEVIQALNSVYSYYFKPIFLIFDQFEELFLTDYKEEELRRKEQKQFYSNINEIIQFCPFCHMIFVMRGEFMDRIDEFESSLPNRLNKRQRVKPLDKEATIDAITRTVNELDGVELQSNQVSELAADAMSLGQRELGMTYFQVFLDALYRRAEKTSSGTVVFTEDLVAQAGQTENILGSFLEEQVHIIEGVINDKYPPVPTNTVTEILEEFISPDETKQPVNKDELLEMHFRAEHVNTALEELTSARIIRPKPELDGYFELTHDVLVRHIASQLSPEDLEFRMIVRIVKNRALDFDKFPTPLSEKEIALVDKYEQRLIDERRLNDETHWKIVAFSRKEVAAQQRKKKNIKRLAWVGGVVTIITTAVLIVFLNGPSYVSQMQAAQEHLKKGETSEALAIFADLKSNPYRMVAQNDPQSEIDQLNNKVAIETKLDTTIIDGAYDALLEFGENSEHEIEVRTEKLIAAYINLCTDPLVHRDSITSGKMEEIIDSKKALVNALEACKSEFETAGSRLGENTTEKSQVFAVNEKYSIDYNSMAKTINEVLEEYK